MTTEIPVRADRSLKQGGGCGKSQGRGGRELSLHLLVGAGPGLVEPILLTASWFAGVFVGSPLGLH